MSDWKPIEMAPHGAQSILISDRKRVMQGWFSEINKRWCSSAEQFGVRWKPTHWMPLPEPPSAP